MSVPAEIDRLFHADGPVDVTHRGPGSIVLRCAGLELRFVRSVDGWEFDEVVGRAMVHIEQMSDVSYWLGLTTDEGEVHLAIGSVSGRARVSMTGWLDA